MWDYILLVMSVSLIAAAFCGVVAVIVEAIKAIKGK
jgi:hypothetical protein